MAELETKQCANCAYCQNLGDVGICGLHCLPKHLDDWCEYFAFRQNIFSHLKKANDE